MPTPLTIINLAGFTVNQTGTIDLSSCAPTSNPRYINQTSTLQIYNESAAGLRFNGVAKGNNFDVPAGGWVNAAIDPGETTLIFTVVYVLPNPSVSVLLATYYSPNEGPPTSTAQLGNSPVNISGGSLSASTSVDNENNGIGTEFIKAKPTPGAFGIYGFQTVHVGNDASFWLESPAASNSVGEQNIACVPGGSLTHGHIEMDAAQIKTDGTGGMQTSKTNVLLTSNQETGHYFTQFVAPSTVAWDFWVPFKQVMTNVPSSITLSGTTNVNCTPTTGGITKYGFRLILTPSGAATTSCDTDWVTVGN